VCEKGGSLATPQSLDKNGIDREATSKVPFESIYWFGPAALTIVGIPAGYFLGWRVAAGVFSPTIRDLIRNNQELSRNLASGRNSALRVLRRELADGMLRKDPERFLQTCSKVHEAAKAGPQRSAQRTL
jgi:hypothetical protein